MTHLAPQRLPPGKYTAVLHTDERESSGMVEAEVDNPGFTVRISVRRFPELQLANEGDSAQIIIDDTGAVTNVQTTEH